MKKFFKNIINGITKHLPEIFALLGGFFFGSLLIVYLVKIPFLATYLGCLWGLLSTCIAAFISKIVKDRKEGIQNG